VVEEVAAAHQLHGEEELPRGLEQLPEPHQIGVLDVLQRAKLLFEPHQGGRAEPLNRLQRHLHSASSRRRRDAGLSVAAVDLDRAVHQVVVPAEQIPVVLGGAGRVAHDREDGGELARADAPDVQIGDPVVRRRSPTRRSPGPKL